MSALPIIDPLSVRGSARKTMIAAWLRLGLLLLIAIAVRIHHNQQRSSRQADQPQIDLQEVQPIVPGAARLLTPVGGQQQILAADGQSLGYATTTLPAASDVIGYRGPSNVLLILDEQSSVTAARLISSEDTPEHVAAILNDPAFLKQFQGWTPGQPNSLHDIDATSGATLTSLAIAEGIGVRMGHEKPSLRFPDDIQKEDLSLVFETPEALRLQPVNSVEATIVDDSDQAVGRLIRTGPLVDSIVGYQGPSEILIALNADEQVTHLALRRTFDNQPYAGYLNDEPYFWKPFQQKTLAELQLLDLEAEQVEGVSGATMTSLAVAESVIAAARTYQQRLLDDQSDLRRRTLHWSTHDTGTVVILCGGLLVGLTGWRGRRWVRTAWNLTLVIYFGLMTGNLISLAVFMGWAAAGVAWRLAPGLTLVLFVSLLLPPLTRRNLYCSHLCPHGAAQQLLKHRLRTKWRLNQVWARRFRWMPGCLLLLAALATVFGTTWNLAAWEPFNAWIWYVAGTSSIVLAVVSLSASAIIPMAYCRYGCATGRLLEYARRSATADRFTRADAVALTIAGVALLRVLPTA